MIEVDFLKLQRRENPVPPEGNWKNSIIKVRLEINKSFLNHQILFRSTMPRVQALQVFQVVELYNSSTWVQILRLKRGEAKLGEIGSGANRTMMEPLHLMRENRMGLECILAGSL